MYSTAPTIYIPLPHGGQFLINATAPMKNINQTMKDAIIRCCNP